MMKQNSDMAALTPKAVHNVLRRFFPAQNDNFVCGYDEECNELSDFGITNEGQLISLLEKRARQVMEIDRSPMDEFDLQAAIEADGEASVENRLRAGFWFSFPALLRIALELEYGKAYEAYANKRDGFPDEKS